MMKLVFLTTSLLLIVNLTNGQFGQLGKPASFNWPLDEYIELTSKIMDTLGIRKRDSLNLDGPIKIYVLPTLKNFDCVFGGQSLIKDSNMSTRFYSDPRIGISSVLDSIFSAKRGVNSYKDAIESETSIIHELAHYLQFTYDTINSDQLLRMYQQSEKLYISVPKEKEAIVVGCYFFLRRIKPEKLSEIMLSNKSLNRKFEMIIDAYRGENSLPTLF